MKRVFVAVAVLAALGVTVTAFAHGRGFGRGPGDDGIGLGMNKHGMKMARYLDLSKEQLDKMGELQKRYAQDIAPLRDELLRKRLEVKALYADPAAKESAIMTKQQEMDMVRQKIRDDVVQLRLEQRRILTPEQLSKLAELKPGRGFRGQGGGLD